MKDEKQISAVRDRLTTYIVHKGITQASFGVQIGATTNYVSTIRQSITPDKLVAIVENFPDLDIKWLLTGIGSMLGTAAAPASRPENYKAKLSDKDQQIALLREELADKDRQLAESIADKDRQLADKDQQIALLREKLEAKERMLSDKDQQIAAALNTFMRLASASADNTVAAER